MTSTIEPSARARACPGEATPSPRGALKRPAALTKTVDVTGLVDADGGLLDRAIFTDTDLYHQELRRVFAPSWLFLVGSSRVDLQACKLEYSIVSPK